MLDLTGNWSSLAPYPRVTPRLLSIPTQRTSTEEEHPTFVTPPSWPGHGNVVVGEIYTGDASGLHDEVAEQWS